MALGFESWTSGPDALPLGHCALHSFENIAKTLSVTLELSLSIYLVNIDNIEFKNV